MPPHLALLALEACLYHMGLGSSMDETWILSVTQKVSDRAKVGQGLYLTPASTLTHHIGHCQDMSDTPKNTGVCPTLGNCLNLSPAD